MGDPKPSLDRAELQEACFATAAEILMERRPIDVEEIQTLADRYFEIAGDSLLQEFILGQHRHPNLVIRVVKYLRDKHAIPPCGDDTGWFRHMFDCLIELACPNCAGQEEDEQFFQDIEEGIATSRADYQEDD